MAAIATSADGACVFLALETGSNPIIVKATRADLGMQSTAYSPGAGSASNVSMVPGNPDKMLFYGNFGTDITVISHAITAVTNTDISPASLGAKVVNTLHNNPDDPDEIVISVDTDQDLKNTTDNGTTWTDWDTALAFDATALWVLWSGAYFLHRYFVAGDNGVDLDILYSPNEGSSDTKVEDATVGAKANISSLEATLP